MNPIITVQDKVQASGFSDAGKLRDGKFLIDLKNAL